jgi:hypothetical protein
MSPEALSAAIAGIGVTMSLLGSVFITGVSRGRTETRLAMLEMNQDKLATKEQLTGVKEDLAEIKGMFRMTLRDGSDGRQ